MSVFARSALTLLVFAPACSDYELNTNNKADEPSDYGPCIVVTPSEIDFGSFTLGEDDPMTELVTITNECPEGEGNELEIYSATLEDADMPYDLSGFRNFLDHGESTQITVTFEPEDNSEYSTTIWIESDDPDEASVPVYITGNSLLWTTEELSFDVEYATADIAFVLDTTCSMSALASQVASDFNNIATALYTDIPNLTFGVAVYQDYLYASYGSSGDAPFVLRRQQTDDISAVQSSLSSVSIAGGNDSPESSLEALYQAATGEGYDTNCNGTFNSGDVKPFVQNAADAFGGNESGTYISTTSGGGSEGGMGFREGVLPIIIYATDNELRDPDGSYGSPGGCNQDAGMSDTVSALNDMGAVVIGVGVNVSSGSRVISQMETLATAVGSTADLDGNGTLEPAVVRWSSGSSGFETTITNAVQALVEDLEFTEVWLDVIEDDDGVVGEISPESYTGVAAGETVDFSVEFMGEVVDAPASNTSEVVLGLYGSDGSTGRLLEEQTFYIEVTE